MMKALRREIWNAMLDSDMNSRYWGFMGARYSNWDMTVKIVLAITASTTVAAWGIWSQYPIWWKALSGLSAILAAIQPVINLTKKAEAMAGVAAEMVSTQAGLPCAVAGVEHQRRQRGRAHEPF
jgi:hypothetical protein